MWNTGYKRLDDGRWFIAYQDDASRFITGFGVFEEATGAHALEVLEQAIRNHGKPASILTDHGPQFYANEKEAPDGGGSEFEKELVRLGIRHVLTRTRHAQTNSKLKRFYGELQRHLASFEEESVKNTTRITGGPFHVGGPFHSAGEQDEVTRLVLWYNEERTHMSLGSNETPQKAFARMMAPAGQKVADGQTGEGHDAG